MQLDSKRLSCDYKRKHVFNLSFTPSELHPELTSASRIFTVNLHLAVVNVSAVSEETFYPVTYSTRTGTVTGTVDMDMSLRRTTTWPVRRYLRPRCDSNH